MLHPDLTQHVAEDVNPEGAEVKHPEVENPFSFTPQLIGLHKDHELFEVTMIANVIKFI